MASCCLKLVLLLSLIELIYPFNTVQLSRWNALVLIRVEPVITVSLWWFCLSIQVISIWAPVLLNNTIFFRRKLKQIFHFEQMKKGLDGEWKQNQNSIDSIHIIWIHQWQINTETQSYCVFVLKTIDVNKWSRVSDYSCVCFFLETNDNRSLE